MPDEDKMRKGLQKAMTKALVEMLVLDSHKVSSFFKGNGDPNPMGALNQFLTGFSNCICPI